MAVKFIIDSASDVLPGECKKLGAVHVPLTVRFGDKEFADAVDLSHKKFYKMLTSGKEEHPTTSQVTPAAWAEAMEEVTSSGDTAVVITISSKLSGTYQSAMIAVDDYENIFVVDTGSVAMGGGILAEYALQLLDAGKSAAEIAAALEKQGVKLDKRKIVLGENIRTGQQVEKFTLYAQVKGKWKKLASETVIGHKRICRFDEIRVRYFKVVIEKARCFATISKFEAY